MKTIYMALNNHGDHQLLDLFTDNLPWLTKNFSTLMLESVPVDYQNEEALSYFFNMIKDYIFEFDFHKIFNPEELLFLKTPFQKDSVADQAGCTQPSPNLERLTFVERRIELISRLMSPGVRAAATIEKLHKPLGIFKGYRLFSQCLKNGIQLKGMEPSSYRAGFGIFDCHGVRDRSMLDAIKKAGEEKSAKGIFILVGATHGISLIPELATLGQFNCSFIRLATDEKNIDKTSPFSMWLTHTAPRLLLGPENYLVQKIIDHSSPKESQTALLESTLRVVQGPALPPNLVRDLDSGLYKVLAKN